MERLAQVPAYLLPLTLNDPFTHTLVNRKRFFTGFFAASVARLEDSVSICRMGLAAGAGGLQGGSWAVCRALAPGCCQRQSKGLSRSEPCLAVHREPSSPLLSKEQHDRLLVLYPSTLVIVSEERNSLCFKVSSFWSTFQLSLTHSGYLSPSLACCSPPPGFPCAPRVGKGFPSALLPCQLAGEQARGMLQVIFP